MEDIYLKEHNRRKLVNEYADEIFYGLQEGSYDFRDLAYEGLKGANDFSNRELLNWYKECHNR